MNASFAEGRFPKVWKEMVIKLFLRKQYWPQRNLTTTGLYLKNPFGETAFEVFLEEADYLDPFQFGFRPSWERESALLTGADALRRETDQGVHSC